jgi:23S rRNA pseudouridine2605 synthase
MSKNSPSGERPSLGKRKTDNFNKFYNKKRNSAIKEAFRQEKKTAKKDRKQAIERHFEDRRKTHTPHPAPGKPIRGGAPANPSQKPRAAAKPGQPAPSAQPAPTIPTETLPLNKYIAHGGLCSRRDAAELVRQGKVTVNGQLITEPGTKVHPTDTGQSRQQERSRSPTTFVYILLNKPKDYITTTDDPQGRRTVLDLIRPATTERVYPHRPPRPQHLRCPAPHQRRRPRPETCPPQPPDQERSITSPSTSPSQRADFDKIAAGAVTLEDGPAPVDDLAYADPKDKTQIGLEIHSGRNRIVRRIFEQLGYDVRGLDRVMYAGLTKKNVQRGHWRLLSEKEVRILKYLNSSIKGSPGRVKGPGSRCAGDRGNRRKEFAFCVLKPSNTPSSRSPNVQPVASVQPSDARSHAQNASVRHREDASALPRPPPPSEPQKRQRHPAPNPKNPAKPHKPSGQSQP